MRLESSVSVGQLKKEEKQGERERIQVYLLRVIQAQAQTHWHNGNIASMLRRQVEILGPIHNHQLGEMSSGPSSS